MSQNSFLQIYYENYFWYFSEKQFFENFLIDFTRGTVFYVNCARVKIALRVDEGGFENIVKCHFKMNN